MKERANSGSSRSSRLLVVVLVALVMTIFVYLNTPSNYYLRHVGKLANVVKKHSSHLVRRIIPSNNKSISAHGNSEGSLNSSQNTFYSPRMSTTTVKIVKDNEALIDNKTVLEHVTTTVLDTGNVSETPKEAKMTSKPLNVSKAIIETEKSRTYLTTATNEMRKTSENPKTVTTTRHSSIHKPEDVNGDKGEKKRNKMETTTVFDPKVVSKIVRNTEKQITTTEDMVSLENDIENVTSSPIDGISATEEYKVPTPSEIQPAFVRIYKENEFYDKYGLLKDLSNDLNSDDKMMKVIQDSLIQQKEPEKKSKSREVLPPTLWPVTSTDK